MKPDVYKRQRPTQLAEEILEDAEILLRQAWQNALPLRSIGISVFDLCLDQTGEQLDLFVDEQHLSLIHIFFRNIMIFCGK